MVPSSPKTCAQAARTYLERGWSVVPVRPGGKRPLLPWEAYQHRLAAPEEAAAWFRRWPDAAVGVVTGAVSGLVVLDVDPRHGGDGSLQALEARHGPLPVTVEARTGGGGRHLYFVHPGGTVRNQVGLAPGMDLRADGGLVVAPPSRHASGRRYRWQPGRGPGEAALAPLPPWLAAHGGTHPGHPLSHWRHLAREGVQEGARNQTIASLAGHLLWHGVDVQVVRELLVCWNAVRCRPPLPEEEVERTVASIARRHDAAEAPDP
ncbi:MAG TPA: bifunctional DNA primase/polymerase [Gammaproteobacteria bacterium]|nr:bifunctional DNA primase/polymerase [Gammaproteobacteria bacterium]